MFSKTDLSHEKHFWGGVDLVSVAHDAAILVRRYMEALSSLPEVDREAFLGSSSWPLDPDTM